MQLDRRSYAVILVSGAEDGGKRATLALSAACTAQAMDLNTIVFLVGDGVHWGYEGHAEAVHAAGFPPLAELMESFLECGGQVLLCSACDAVCALPVHAGAKPPSRRPGVHPQGLAAVLSHTVEGSALTF
jgi:predicted peroxiredoxin